MTGLRSRPPNDLRAPTLALAVGRLCRNTLRPERPSGSGEMRFQTYSHSELKFDDDLFYPLLRYPEGGRKKRVPENIH